MQQPRISRTRSAVLRALVTLNVFGGIDLVAVRISHAGLQLFVKFKGHGARRSITRIAHQSVQSRIGPTNMAVIIEKRTNMTPCRIQKIPLHWPRCPRRSGFAARQANLAERAPADVGGWCGGEPCHVDLGRLQPLVCAQLATGQAWS